LEHPQAMLSSIKTVRAERARMMAKFQGMGLEVMPSKGNFLFVNGRRSAVELADRLITEGVLIKPWKQAGYETWFRVSVGLKHENDQFLSALAQVI